MTWRPGLEPQKTQSRTRDLHLVVSDVQTALLTRQAANGDGWSGNAALPRASSRYFCVSSAATPSANPLSEIGMPMPASSVWKMMKIAVLPVFSFSMSESSTTTCA